MRMINEKNQRCVHVQCAMCSDASAGGVMAKANSTSVCCDQPHRVCKENCAYPCELHRICQMVDGKLCVTQNMIA